MGLVDIIANIALKRKHSRNKEKYMHGKEKRTKSRAITSVSVILTNERG
jgi:hypothetical protein